MKVKVWDLVPVKEWHTTQNLSGDNYSGVNDLPCTRYWENNQEMISSIWKAPFWARLYFVFTGKIQFSCYGINHPPVRFAIVRGEYFLYHT